MIDTVEMVIIITGVTLVSLFVLSIFCADWASHISMNKDRNKPYGWGNYNQFVEEFNKYKNWTIQTPFSNSFFGEIITSAYRTKDTRYYIHAGIVIFDDKCMNLYPLSYFRAKRFLKKEYEKKLYSNRTKIKW